MTVIEETEIEGWEIIQGHPGRQKKQKMLAIVITMHCAKWVLEVSRDHFVNYMTV